MQITGCSQVSLMEWCRKYRSNGRAMLADQPVGGNRAQLSPGQIKDLKQRLHLDTPCDHFGQTAAAASAAGQFWTVPAWRRAMERWDGVSYHSPSAYLGYLALCGFSYQRPAKVYQSPKEAQVVEFQAELEKN